MRKRPVKHHVRTYRKRNSTTVNAYVRGRGAKAAKIAQPVLHAHTSSARTSELLTTYRYVEGTGSVPVKTRLSYTASELKALKNELLEEIRDYRNAMYHQGASGSELEQIDVAERKCERAASVNGLYSTENNLGMAFPFSMIEAFVKKHTVKA